MSKLDVATKECSSCEKMKPLTEFYRDATQVIDDFVIWNGADEQPVEEPMGVNGDSLTVPCDIAPSIPIWSGSVRSGS